MSTNLPNSSWFISPPCTGASVAPRFTKCNLLAFLPSGIVWFAELCCLALRGTEFCCAFFEFVFIAYTLCASKPWRRPTRETETTRKGPKESDFIVADTHQTPEIGVAALPPAEIEGNLTKKTRNGNLEWLISSWVGFWPCEKMKEKED